MSRRTLTITGLLLSLAYRLRRHFFLGWSVSRWLGLALFVLALWCAVRWRPNPWPAAAIGLAWLVYLAVLVWAARRRYTRFEPVANAEDLLRQASPSPPLDKLEMMPVRATGWFSVEGLAQFYADIEADFETGGTREHIVLGRVHPSRFLLLANWPAHELGWWYIFFQPASMRSLRLGHLHFGPRACLALQVVYLRKREKEEKLESVYLTFANPAALRRVWEDLVRDAPMGIAT